MKREKVGEQWIYNAEPKLSSLSEEVFAGLDQTPKSLPCKLFYDERGSKLFDRICTLEEYYPTRTEMGIMEENITEITSCLGENCLLVEFGSGAGIKTLFLLDHVNNPAAYLPIEIDKTILARSAEQLSSRYPDLEIIPVCADFHDSIVLPRVQSPVDKTVAFFPGSTLGNFSEEEAMAFLHNVAAMCGKGGGLLIGIDMKKDRDVLEKAYNDGEGVTAAFNLNLLERINREMDAGFDLDAFAHRAVYNEEHGRIEMHIVSRKEQTVNVDGRLYEFDKGERIITEYSYKYDPVQFAEIAAEAGFEVDRTWTDERGYFSVNYLCVRDEFLDRLDDDDMHYNVRINGESPAS